MIRNCDQVRAFSVIRNQITMDIYHATMKPGEALNYPPSQRPESPPDAAV
jgi:hypothetical protein